MKIGIIGSGQIAKIHGPIILKQPDIKIIGIVDKDLVRAKALAAQLQVNQVYQDAETMIDEQKPDLIHILTPPQYHAPLSIMAMNRGCHVLVEKPMALNVPDAKEMIEVAKQNNVRLCVDHTLIYEDHVQRVIALTSAGVIGEVVSVEVHYAYDARRASAILEEGAEYVHWMYRLNGGPLEDLMPHMAALIFEFIPGIQDVCCAGYSRGMLPEGWQDEIRVLVTSTKATGYISVSLNEKPDTILLTVKGTKGTVQANLFSSALTLQKESRLPRAVARGLSGFQLGFQYFGGSLRNISKFVTGRIDKSGGMETVISRFYESVRNRGETPISLEKSLCVVDLVNRIWPKPVKDVENISHLSFSFLKNRQTTPTAFVTGASGFIGIHLIKKLLSENIEVRALVRPYSIHTGRLKNFNVDIVEGDLADTDVLYEATKGIKTIYHVGAAVNNDWEENYRSTIKGTENIIEAALVHQVERFLYVSSIVVYERTHIERNARIDEDQPCLKNPKEMGAYAFSKIQAEELVFNAYKNRGLKATVIRPGSVIGPMGQVFFPLLGYRYQDGLFLVIGKGDTLLPLTYVENTVDALYLASITETAIGQVYNLVDDSDITVRGYLENFIKVTGVDARIISLPYLLPYFATMGYELAATLGLLKKGATSRAQLRSKHAAVRYDNTKAKEELGWRPTVPMEEGLVRTFRWYTNHYRH